jgi:hypothetical protein
MEVNKLTYKIYKFLIKKGWSYKDKNDDKFIHILPSERLGFNKGFELRLPIYNKSKDYYLYIRNILEFLETIYGSKLPELQSLIDLNEKLKQRFTKQWILPENKSRIEQINKFDIFIPK